MKDWQKIRQARTDITDYIIHFTKQRPDMQGYLSAKQVFYEIINDGFIRPSFAPIKSMRANTISRTVRGPDPAVCLTEQPLSAVIATRGCNNRYSGFGIAYHKYALFTSGGRPVLYGSEDILGRKLKSNDPGYQEGKDIYEQGLSAEHQYLWVRYQPEIESDNYPVDFTWEREWRYKCIGNRPLPLFLDLFYYYHQKIPMSALVVERDEHIHELREYLAGKADQGSKWAAKLTKIVSLETVERMLEMGDEKYERIETYPD